MGSNPLEASLSHVNMGPEHEVTGGGIQVVDWGDGAPAEWRVDDVQWAEPFDRILVHVDVDVLNYDQFPIAENTRRRAGLSLVSLGTLLNELCALPNWRALTMAEINPEHAPDEEQSFQQLIAMLGDVLEP